METNYFALRDGKIVYVPDVPEKRTVGGKTFEGITDSGTYEGLKREYEQALQSAIANGIEVDDVDQLVMKKIYGQDGLEDGLPVNFYAWKKKAEGRFYPLQCRVEKDVRYNGRKVNEDGEPCDDYQTVARVTFDEQVEKKDDAFVLAHKKKKSLSEKLDEVSKKLNEEEKSRRVQNTEQLLVSAGGEAAGQEQETQHKCIYCNGTGYSNKPPLGQ